MIYDFDTCPDRRRTECEKWDHYPADVLPLWVADMDFVSPEPVVRALRERVAHGVFGYGAEPRELRDLIVARMAERYAWQIQRDDIVFTPGVIRGFNLACHTVGAPGGGVLVQPPVYPPMLSAASHAGMIRQEAQLARATDGSYSIDWDIFESAITEQTRVFILCNPHNPVGRVFRRDELVGMAEMCLRRGVVICSDEIHCDLVYSGHRHIPIASLDPEIARNTITLMAPSKTFNIAGLDCAFAIIQNEELRKRYKHASRGLMGGINIMGWVGAVAAYRDGQEWLTQALAYLESNRDYVYAFVEKELPGITITKLEATYLAWLDCRATGLDRPYEFFLRDARVALNDGATFGCGGEGFVRLNFGCPRSILREALERMKTALTENR
ncbi:MAG: PatB family C-S lyase [Chloroflexota bacterium]